MQDSHTGTHTQERRGGGALVGIPTIRWLAVGLVAIVLLMGATIVIGYAIVGTDEQPLSTSMKLDSPKGKPLNQDTALNEEQRVVEEGRSGISGHSGTLGWEWLDSKKNNGQIPVTVHHVIASDYGIYFVYSLKTEDPDDRLGPEIVTKHISDGLIATVPAEEHLIGTDGKVYVRIVSLGKPMTEVTTHGMNIAVDTANGRSDISMDVIRDETPGVVEKRITMMSNPDPEVAYLLFSEYGSVTARSGTTFGVHPGFLIATQTTPAYFMINSNVEMRQITSQEVIAFTDKHVSVFDDKLEKQIRADIDYKSTE